MGHTYSRPARQSPRTAVPQPAENIAWTFAVHGPAHTLSYDHYSMAIDGHRVVLFGGEYQFWRTPSPQRWPVILSELRAAGLNTVSVGVSWQYHSPAPGVFDFSGARDLGRFLDDAAAAGLYVIARPGPFYDSESNASNIPGWVLASVDNLRANSGSAYCGTAANSPSYRKAYTDWFRHVLPIIAARQITGGSGTVIALQIENEYSPLCGATGYMRDLHDLSRHLGIVVPLLANNNTCCSVAGAWAEKGDDGQPIVNLPAEDDYPCPGSCPANWNSSIVSMIDSIEQRLRGAGVTDTPLAIAELQGGFYTGWGGTSYTQMAGTLGPQFDEVLDGSVLAQGVTIVSIYMVAGGTTWGYLGGPNTATSYDYVAPIHEWGEPSASYDSLKRTGMFVEAFGDALAATRLSKTVHASNPSLLDAVRETVDGTQRGAQLIVLRNTDPQQWSSTRLHVKIDGHDETVPHSGRGIALAPHSLALLLAGYNLGPFRLRYATSRPLTQALINGDEIAVFYGPTGISGEIALAFARKPAILHADRGIVVSFDRRAGELRLDYKHRAQPATIVLSSGGHHLVLVLADVTTAAHTWRITGPRGTALVIGPRMMGSPVWSGNALDVQATLRGATPIMLWVSGGAHAVSMAGTTASSPTPRIAPAQLDAATHLSEPPGLHYHQVTRAASVTLAVRAPATTLPALTSWRFATGSPETLPLFDDRGWLAANETATANPNVPASDTLLADDYGFHYGFVWYRGTFVGTGAEHAILLQARNSYSVWLNGHYLGTSTLHNDLKDLNDQEAVHNPAPSNDRYADTLTFAFPSWRIRVGKPNTIAVLVESLGHNIGFANGERARSPFGILSARLIGRAAPPVLHWKLEGAGDSPQAPFNASGLYGERNGWYRPGFDDSSWTRVRVPDDWAARGLHYQGVGWYRTTFSLNLPHNLDLPLGLYIPTASDKVVIWLNGVLIGRYWDAVGPQHMFYLPDGLLNCNGRNTLALAVWNRGHDGGLTGGVSLRAYEENALVTLRLGGR